MTGSRTVLVVIVAVLLASPGLAAAVGGAQPSEVPAGDVEASASGSAAAASLPGTSVVLAQENNSTRHVHPDDVDEDGDLRGVESWLASRLSSRMERSSVQLSQGEYEQARSLVGDDYRELAGKYVEVTGETRGAGDDSFREAGETQDELASDVREYQETREEYREARNEGDEQRARELARDLERRAEAVDETGRALQDQYETVSNATGANLEDGTEAVESVRTNVSEQQAEVRSETFVETRLSLSTDAETVSFADPMAATGRLVAANGSAVANRSILLRVGERDVATRTDEAGRFSLTYRPTTVPVGEQDVPVRYLPANASAYLGSEDRVPVTVEQVEPRLDLSTPSDVVSFDDRIALNGSVVADGTGASGVPVNLTLGGKRLGRATTGADGSFTVEGRVPATVEAGEHDLSARVALEDRALASTATNTSVAVETTGTRLSLDEPSVESGGLRVSGTLESVDGRPVPDGRVVVTLGGTRLGPVRSDDDGSFAAALDVPGGVRPATGQASRDLVATFDGERTNLDDSRATTEVTVPALDGAGGNGGTGGDGFRLPLPWVDDLRLSGVQLVGVGVAGSLLIAGLAAVLRRRDGTDDDGSGQPRVAADTGGAQGEVTSGRHVTEVTDTAARHLEEGATDAAVETAYGGVRGEIEAAYEVAGSRTHWEFLHATRRAGLNGDGYDALAALTEGYERAAFAPGVVSVEEAERAVEIARSIAPKVERDR